MRTIKLWEVNMYYYLENKWFKTYLEYDRTNSVQFFCYKIITNEIKLGVHKIRITISPRSTTTDVKNKIK